MDNLLSLYMNDLNNSQGFYVPPLEDGFVLPEGFMPVKREYSDDHHQRAERAAKFAVEDHNKSAGESGLLKFQRILYLNMQSPATTTVAAVTYYVTMDAADVSGETTYYEVKVSEELNGCGYQVEIFRKAPFWRNISDLFEETVCSVGINDLLPWMNESYLYYKCFYKVRSEVLGVDVIRDEESGFRKGVLWFKSCAASEECLKQYVGETMPCSNKVYDFDLDTCSRNRGFPSHNVRIYIY